LQLNFALELVDFLSGSFEIFLKRVALQFYRFQPLLRLVETVASAFKLVFQLSKFSLRAKK
jgi:hypothetical protein